MHAGGKGYENVIVTQKSYVQAWHVCSKKTEKTMQQFYACKSETKRSQNIISFPHLLLQRLEQSGSSPFGQKYPCGCAQLYSNSQPLLCHRRSQVGERFFSACRESSL